MRKYFLITIFSLILVLLEESFAGEFLGAALNPNLILALSFAFLFADDRRASLYSALIGGLWLDLMGVGIVGLSSFMLVLLLILASWIRNALFKGVWVQVVVIVCSTMLFKLIMNYPQMNYSWKLVVAGILTSLISLIFYWGLSRTRQRFLSFEFRIRA